ncbi:MAG: asparagine--tRNA ligase, partial [Terriglobales bacterium]
MSNPDASVPTVPVVAIRDVGRFEGQKVRLQGWLYNLRASGKLLFPILRDGTGWMQGVVFQKNIAPEKFDALKSLSQESSLEVTGTVRADARAAGGYELDVADLSILQAVDAAHPYPITPKEHGIEFLLEHRHLWLRSQRQAAILRVRHEIIKAVRDFFDGDGFVLGDAPILTPASCEGTSNLFEVDYFDDKAYLTQSGQLYAEAVAMAVGKTYTFGPTFRAEKSKTRRHLAEFWMVEPEVAFMDLDGDMRLAEEFIAFIVARVLETRREELRVLERDTAKLEQVVAPFPRITYAEAIAILQQNGH